MSPNIEWHVDDDSGKRVLATPPPPRWRRVTLGFALVLVLVGFGLGVIYSMLGNTPAEPMPSPVPMRTLTPMPTHTPQPAPTLPPSLTEAVVRDTRALAMHELVITSTEPQSGDTLKWYQALLDANRWAYQLYTIVDSGTLSTGGTWVDLHEYQPNGIFRHTRFYRLLGNSWVWTLPDPAYWSGERQTLSFDQSVLDFPVEILFPVEDQPLISETAARFADVRRRLCDDLDCPSSPVVTLTLIIDPQLTRHRVLEQGRWTTVTLPSPRVLGLYDSYYGGVNDPIRSIAYDSLIEPMVCAASGAAECWSSTDHGQLFVRAIAAWQRQRVKTVYQLQEFFFNSRRNPAFILPPLTGHVSIQRFYTNLLADTHLLPLPMLWSTPLSLTGESAPSNIAQVEVMATVAFIDQKYGTSALAHFLHALGSADSLPQSIESGLGLPYAEFERQWQEWLDRK